MFGMDWKSIKNNTIVRASALNFIGTFLLKGITYISVPIFTRIMEPDAYGYVSTYATYIAFLGIIIGLSLNTATANARIDYEKRFDEYNGSVLRFSFFAFLIEWGLANIFFRFLGKALNIGRINLNIVFLILNP